jgi:hypothetical protein
MDGVTKLNNKMSDDGYGGQVESRVVISDGMIIMEKAKVGENVKLVGGPFKLEAGIKIRDVVGKVRSQNERLSRLFCKR